MLYEETCQELSLPFDGETPPPKRSPTAQDAQTSALPADEDLERGEGGRRAGGVILVWPPRYGL